MTKLKSILEKSVTRKVTAFVLCFALLTQGLLTGNFNVGASSVDLSDYDISLGADVITNRPASLRDGEVWTGKSVTHNLDGTVTVTLSVWGKTYWGCKECVDIENKECKPGSVFAGHSLVERPPLSAEDPFVYVEDDFNRFKMIPSSETGGWELVYGSNENKRGWRVHQDSITGASPSTLQYTLELDDEDYKEFNDITSEWEWHWFTGFWYSTNIANARFTPCFLDPEYYPFANPFYFTKGEITYDSFTMSMNWNNGNGLNSGTITDKIFGETITFGANKSPQFQSAYAPPRYNPANNLTPMSNPVLGAGWNSVAGMCATRHTTACKVSPTICNWAFNARRPTINRSVYPFMPVDYDWHLEWEKTNSTKSYWFTVRNIDRAKKVGVSGNTCSFYSINRINSCPVAHLWHETTNPTGCFNILDVIYEVFFPNPGGNDSQPAGRERSGDDYFQRSFEEGDQTKLFEWDGDSIRMVMNVKGYVMLEVSGWNANTGTLMIDKELEGWYEPVWNVTQYSEFTAVIRVKDRFDNFSYYLKLNTIEDPVPGHPAQYSYNGVTDDRTLASVVKFYPYHPAVLVGIPSNLTLAVEEFYNINTQGMINVTYTHDSPTLGIVTETHPKLLGIDGISGATQKVQVTNDYRHGIGKLEIHKLFDGFPSDWGVNDHTTFYLRVWDHDAVNSDNTVGNYLLFQSTPGPDGTYRCVGNAAWGLSEPYANPVTVLPISADKHVVVSNLWSWGRYRVEEVIWDGVGEPVFRRVLSPANRYDDWANIHEDWKNPNQTADLPYEVIYSADNGARHLEFDETIVLGITNRFKRSTEKISIFKELTGSPSDWGVTDDTVFRARVRKYVNNAPAHTLVFDRTPIAEDGSYLAVGHYGCGGTSSCLIDGSMTVLYDSGLGQWVHYAEQPALGYTVGASIAQIPFSVNNPALLSGMWEGPEHTYYIEELRDTNTIYHDKFDAYYSLNHVESIPALSNGIVVPTVDGDNLVVTIENNFEHQLGNLAIYKTLNPAGFHDEWGVDNNTLFNARVRIGNTSPPQYITADASNAYTGVSTSGTVFSFSVNSPVVISGVPADSTVYVEEIFTGTPYDGYVKQTNSIPDGCGINTGECLSVMVTNLFMQDGISMSINKEIDGYTAHWGIDNDTVFNAVLKDTNDDTQLVFTVDSNGNYRCIGHLECSDASCRNKPASLAPSGEMVCFSDTIITGFYTEIPFSVNNKAEITNLWPGRVYLVEEVGGANYTSSYKFEYETAEYLKATVLNTFEPPPSYQVNYHPNWPEPESNPPNRSGGVPSDSSDYLEGDTADVIVSPASIDIKMRNWVFVGWSRNPAATTAEFWEGSPNQIVIQDDDVDLYAVWVPRPLVRDVSKEADNTSVIGDSKSYNDGNNILYTISFKLPPASAVGVSETVRIRDTFPNGELTYTGVHTFSIAGTPASPTSITLPAAANSTGVIDALIDSSLLAPLSGGEEVVLTLDFAVQAGASGIIRNTASVYVKTVYDESPPADSEFDGTASEIIVEDGKAGVVYNPNWPRGKQGSGTVPEDNTLYVPAETADVKTNEGGLTKPGYKFLGWSRNPADTTAEFPSDNPGTITITTADEVIILYGVWVLDIDLEKTPSQERYNVRNTIDYTISFTMPIDMSGYDSVRIEDVFPATLTYADHFRLMIGDYDATGDVSVIGTGSEPRSVVIDRIGSSDLLAFSEGRFVQLTMSFVVADGADANIENTANVYFKPDSLPEPSVPDGSGTAEITPHVHVPPSDLEKTAIPPMFSKVGDLIEYSISFTLPTDVSAYEGLLVYDELPDTLTFINGSGRINLLGVTVTGTSGRLGAYINKETLENHAGEQVVLTFTARINSSWDGASDIINESQLFIQRITGVQPNPNTDTPDANNPVVITPIEQPSTFTKVATSGSAFSGSGAVVVYGISLVLPSDVSGYEGVLIYDELPSTLTYVSSAVNFGTVSENNGRVTASIDKATLIANAGATVTLTINATVNSSWTSGNIVNRAELYIQLIPGVTPIPGIQTPDDDDSVTITHLPVVTTTAGGGGIIFLPNETTTVTTVPATTTGGGGVGTSAPTTAPATTTAPPTTDNYPTGTGAGTPASDETTTVTTDETTAPVTAETTEPSTASTVESPTTAETTEAATTTVTAEASTPLTTEASTPPTTQAATTSPTTGTTAIPTTQSVVTQPVTTTTALITLPPVRTPPMPLEVGVVTGIETPPVTPAVTTTSEGVPIDENPPTDSGIVTVSVLGLVASIAVIVAVRRRKGERQV
jgi:fimbrial isopeptide formation D2 family protein